MGNRSQKYSRGRPEDRRARLAAQLRANLGKRKTQALARAAEDDETPAKQEGEGEPKSK